LARYLRDQKPDVVLSTVFSANIAAIIATKCIYRRARLVLREASRTDMQLRSHRGLQRFIDSTLRKLLYPKADFVISVSQDVEANLVASRLIGRNKSKVIYNPLTRTTLVNKSRSTDRQDPPMILAC